MRELIFLLFSFILIPIFNFFSNIYLVLGFIAIIIFSIKYSSKILLWLPIAVGIGSLTTVNIMVHYQMLRQIELEFMSALFGLILVSIIFPPIILKIESKIRSKEKYAYWKFIPFYFIFLILTYISCPVTVFFFTV